MYTDTADDLNKKYAGTYFWYNGELVYAAEFQNRKSPEGASDEIVTVFPHKNNEILVVVNPDLIKPIEFESAFFNIVYRNEMAFKLMRRAKRQNRKGLCNDTVFLLNPLAELYALFGKTAHTPSFALDTVKNIIASVFPTWPDAIQALKTYHSVAVSPLFALCRSSLDQNFLMLSMFGFIGKATPDSITIYHKPSYQEVRDYLTRSNNNMVLLNASNT